MTIYYDLTELFRAERSRVRYYGIARVVAEVAYETNKLRDSVVWVVFDEVEGRFWQVAPKFGAASASGLVGLDMPGRAFPVPMHGARASEKPLRRFAGQIANFYARLANAANRKIRLRYLRPVRVGEGRFFTAARPKLAVGMLETLRKDKSPASVHVLLHDCFALHDFGPSATAFQVNARDDNSVIVLAADQLIANSQFTRQDLIAKASEGLLPPIHDLPVVRLAQECRPDGMVASIKLPEQPYILGVGMALGRKNLDLVLEALQLILAAGQDPPLLVLAGAMRPRTLSGLLVGRYRGLGQYVRMVVTPPQADLIELYKNAMATVVPSRLEGWGLPIGESLWLGTPVLAALTSSLPEAGGELAVYFGPDDAQMLATLIIRLRDEAGYRDKLAERIRDAKPTLRRWSEVASEMLATIESLDPTQDLPVAGSHH